MKSSTTANKLSAFLSALALAGAATLSFGAGEASAQQYSNCERDSGNICFKADDFYFNPGVGVQTQKGNLSMQADGNLVLKDETGRVRWASDTDGNPGAYALFQEDGNFVVYVATRAGTRSVFATGTDGRGAYLALQVDGNLVIYNHDDEPIWASQSGH